MHYFDALVANIHAACRALFFVQRFNLSGYALFKTSSLWFNVGIWRTRNLI